MKRLLLNLFFFSSLAGFSQTQFVENVEKYRPKFTDDQIPVREIKEEKDTIKITHHQNAEIDTLTDMLAGVYAKIQFTQGWRVQVYSGDDEAKAHKIKLKVQELTNNQIPVYDPWNGVEFKVKAGDYMDRLRAYRLYNILKAEFPTAILVPDKINIKNID